VHHHAVTPSRVHVALSLHIRTERDMKERFRSVPEALHVASSGASSHCSFEGAGSAHRSGLDRDSPTLAVMAWNTSSFDGVASMRTTSSLRPNTSITGSVFA
jgi:hypothetical protein